MAHTLQSVNHNIQDMMLGGISSGLTGEAIKGAEITGSPVVDMVIKIVVPIITGIAIPLVKNYIEERKRRRRK